MEANKWSIEYFVENSEECKKQLEKHEIRSTIPMLNHIPNFAVPNSSLVRFRGMIQDMLDPEFYLEKYTVKSSSSNRIQDGRFRDTIVYQNVRSGRTSLNLQTNKIPYPIFPGGRVTGSRSQGQCAWRATVHVRFVCSRY